MRSCEYKWLLFEPHHLLLRKFNFIIDVISHTLNELSFFLANAQEPSRPTTATTSTSPLVTTAKVGKRRKTTKGPEEQAPATAAIATETVSEPIGLTPTAQPLEFAVPAACDPGGHELYVVRDGVSCSFRCFSSPSPPA